MELVQSSQTVVVPMLDRCIKEEWKVSELRIYLKSAILHSDDGLSTKHNPDSATLHSEQNEFGNGQGAILHSDDELSTKHQGESATLHAEIKMNLDKAANMMLGCTAQDILTLDIVKQQRLSDGIRTVLEVMRELAA